MDMTSAPHAGRAADIYRKILAAVGERIDDLGSEQEIVAHWPFVGSCSKGLMIAGQALDGWDAERTPARWRLEEMRNPSNLDRFLEGAQEWAHHQVEPILEVVQRGNRKGKPFWTFSRRAVTALEPDSRSSWFARYIWWNVYPLAPRRGSPYGLLKDLQTPFVGDLFWAVVEELGVDRILLVSGKDWWPEVRSLLGLESLGGGAGVVIAAGRVHGVSLVATYHPGAHLRGVSREAFAAQVQAAVARLSET